MCCIHRQFTLDSVCHEQRLSSNRAHSESGAGCRTPDAFRLPCWAHPRGLLAPAGCLLFFTFQKAGSHQRASPGLRGLQARTVGDEATKGSDPDHLGSDTWTPPPLPGLCGLPPEVEPAIGAPHLPFGEASGIHADTAKDVLGKKRRLGLERPK